MCTLSDKRYLTVKDSKSLPNDVIGSCYLPLLWEIAKRIVIIPYRRFGTSYLSHSSRVKKSRKKVYLQVQTNAVFRVRQFQPSHAPLIKELCGESLRIFRLNAACLFFAYPLMCRFCIVFLYRIFQIAINTPIPDRHA